MSQIKVLDLFSGIGGFSLGLERAGMETVAFCEIEPFCQKVLKKHWPGIPIHDDIRQLDGTQYRGTVGLICGGYPCQPFSQAGKRAGSEDDRHLWPEMYRVIKTAKPRWVVAENVAGHISMGLDQVLSDLETIGYTCRTFVIPACAVNAPHRRDRVWIVADAEERTVGSGFRKGQPTSIGRRRPGDSCSENVADSIGAGLEGFTGDGDRGREPGWQHSEAVGPTGAGGLSGRAIEWWATEPNVGRVAHGVPRRVDRLRGLGNAVVPQIPEILGRAIMGQK